MNFNFVSSSRGIIENADKAILLILVIIDIIVFIKYIKLKKIYCKFHKKDFADNTSITLDNKSGIEIKAIADNYFINYIGVIKLIELIVIIRMMFIISFFCKNICNTIDNNGPQTGNIYNFVLALISAIFVIVFCEFSIQYVKILKYKLLNLFIQRKMLLPKEQGDAH